MAANGIPGGRPIGVNGKLVSPQPAGVQSASQAHSDPSLVKQAPAYYGGTEGETNPFAILALLSGDPTAQTAALAGSSAKGGGGLGGGNNAWAATGPIGRMLGKDSKDKKSFSPNPQFMYGSPEGLASKDRQFNAGEMVGDAYTRAGVDRGNAAADLAGARLGSFATGQNNQAQANNANFYRQMAAYGASGRTGQLNAGRSLMYAGNNAARNYERTDQASYRAQQDLAQRQALAIAARGGASGIRAALASGAASNVANQNQANITRANESNQILGLQQNAYTNAASIYGNVGSQDQSAAGLYSTRQQNNATNALNATTNAANIQQNAANAQTTAGTSTRGQYLDADVTANSNQLSAQQAFEQQRQGYSKAVYNQKWYPIMNMFQGHI